VQTDLNVCCELSLCAQVVLGTQCKYWFYLNYGIMLSSYSQLQTAIYLFSCNFMTKIIDVKSTIICDQNDATFIDDLKVLPVMINEPIITSHMADPNCSTWTNE